MNFDKIIEAFKTKQGIKGALSFKNKEVIFGENLTSNQDLLNSIFKLIELLEKLDKFDYLTFNLSKYVVIVFRTTNTTKEEEDCIILLGDNTIKEPVIRMAIKSLG